MIRPKVSYVNYCKAFAGVYRKHGRNSPTLHTCYVRSAIRDYVNTTPHRRGEYMEDACGEDAIGYRIAHSLLKCGWTEAQILEYNEQQQEYVDEADDYGFIDCLSRAGYGNQEGFSRYSNGQRYMWLIDGAPSLEEFFDDPEEEEDD